MINIMFYYYYCLVAKPCLTLWNTMDYRPPGSSVHEIFQVRILEWVAISFSMGFPDPVIKPVSPALGGRFFTAQSPGKAWCWMYTCILYTEKQRRYSADKGHMVKAMVCPVFTYGCESWTVEEAEHQRIDGFELWCWRRLLRVPWTARRSNHSILREINPEYSLEGLMLKPKLQFFGHLMQAADSLEKS